MEQWQKETDHAHQRIDSVIADMNRGFTDLRKDMSKDKQDIMTAIRRANPDSQSSWVRQSVGLTVAVIALIGFMVPTMVSIVKPMQQQMAYITKADEFHSNLPGHMSAIADIANLKTEINALYDQCQIQLINLEKRLILQDVDHKDIAITEVADIQRQIQNIKDTITLAAADRFTGAEGAMMQKQIDRLEDRLTVITKIELGNALGKAKE